MKRLVEFPPESGEPILVEVEDMGLAGETRAVHFCGRRTCPDFLRRAVAGA
jgi:hypothetical protein